MKILVVGGIWNHVPIILDLLKMLILDQKTQLCDNNPAYLYENFHLECETFLLNVWDKYAFSKQLMRPFNDHDSKAFGGFLHLYFPLSLVAIKFRAIEDLE